MLHYSSVSRNASRALEAGEKLFVDWAGTSIPIYAPPMVSVRQAHLFVAVGASSYALR
jgi:transposase